MDEIFDPQRLIVWLSFNIKNSRNPQSEVF